MIRLLFLYIVSMLFLPHALISSEIDLSVQESQWLKKHPVIRVSNEDNWPPFDFSVEGEAKGYSIDLIKILTDKIGLEVKFINGYSWAELLKEFDNKNIDLMHVMTKDKQRSKKYLFSKPYMPWKISYLVRDNETKINSPKDFAGKKIAAGEGWSTTSQLKKMYPNAEIICYPNSLKMLEALSTSQVDVAIDNILTVKYLMSENIITNVIHGGYLNLSDKEKNNFHFVSHKDTPEIISIFNKAYESLTMQEKLDLQKKWFGDTKTNSKVDFSQKEKAYLKKKKVIKMCIDPEWMPYEKFDENGKHIGLTADYFEVFQKDLGVDIIPLKTQTWGESLLSAKSRECDIFSLAMPTPERKKYMNFTSAYLSIPLVLATKLNVTFFEDFRSLQDEKIGIVKGYAFNEIIRKKYPNINVVNVENLKDGLQKVANGELFGCIGTLASVGYIFQTDFMGELKIAGKFNEKWELGIGVRNDDPILLNIFEKCIENLSPELKQHIFSKYIAIKYETTTDYSLLLKVLVGGVILFLIGIYHNRKLAHINEKLQQLQLELEEQAHRDPMTNLYNRRYFQDIAEKIMNIAKRDNKEIGVIMLDIDKFKKVNDTYGHAVGDEVIKNLASLLRSHTRESDIIARFGGEEFVILLPNTNQEGTINIATKIREVVQENSLKLENQKSLKFTISLGVSSVSLEDKNIEKSLKRVDEALYEAKESGRNRVCVRF